MTARASLLLTAMLLASSPAPDVHDRALVKRLAARVGTIRAIVDNSKAPAVNASLDHCPALTSPKNALETGLVIGPAATVMLVDDNRPEIVALARALKSMHPDSQLFARWIAALRDQLKVMLELDNHGKKVDLCRVATVALREGSTTAELARLIGVSPKAIMQFNGDTASTRLASLHRRMVAFFIAAGVPAQLASSLSA